MMRGLDASGRHKTGAISCTSGAQRKRNNTSLEREGELLTPADPLASRIQRWRVQREALANLTLRLESLLSPSWQKSLCASPDAATPNGFPEQTVEQFFSRLIDYIANGHFRIYPELLHKACCPTREEAAIIRVNLLFIGKNTDQILAFSDCIEPGRSPEPGLTDGLRSSLKNLCRQLMIRFVLEEQIIDLCQPASATDSVPQQQAPELPPPE